MRRPEGRRTGRSRRRRSDREPTGPTEEGPPDADRARPAELRFRSLTDDRTEKPNNDSRLPTTSNYVCYE